MVKSDRSIRAITKKPGRRTAAANSSSKKADPPVIAIRNLPAAVFTTSFALFSACVTSTQATRLQKDLDDVKREIFQVQQDSAASRSKIEEVARRLGNAEAPSSSQADLSATMRALLDQVQALSERLKETSARMASLSQELQGVREQAGRGGTASGAPAASPPGAGPGAPPGARAGSPADAAFKEFLRSGAGQPLASDAQYFIGECFYSQGKFKEAADAFDQVVQKYPSSDKVAPALLKKGYAQIESGQTASGVATLQKLIDMSPDSGEARLAGERLKQMGLRSR
jgi:tol-pal system protein YbgF